MEKFFCSHKVVQRIYLLYSILKTSIQNHIDYFKMTPKSVVGVNIYWKQHPLLFSHKESWIKKDGDKDFDEPMATPYDGTEICSRYVI